MKKSGSNQENNISLINDACTVIRSNVLLAQSYIDYHEEIDGLVPIYFALEQIELALTKIESVCDISAIK
jgi:hypothetical protein